MDDVVKRREFVSYLYSRGIRKFHQIEEKVKEAGFTLRSRRTLERDIRAAQEEGNNWVMEIGDYGFALLYKTSYEKLEEIEHKLEELADEMDLTDPGKARKIEVKSNIYRMIVDIQDKKLEALQEGPMVWAYSVASKKYPLRPGVKKEPAMFRNTNRLPEEIGNDKLEDSP